jgi:acetyl-CoA synthetase
MCEGAPDYPHSGIWWELCDRYKVTIFYTAPTAIRACMKWGAEYPNRWDIAEGRAVGDVTTLREPDVMKQLQAKIEQEHAGEA